MNTTTKLHTSHDDSLWKAPARPIEVEPWLFALAVVAVVLAIGSWQPHPKAGPSGPSDQATLAAAPART